MCRALSRDGERQSRYSSESGSSTGASSLASMPTMASSRRVSLSRSSWSAAAICSSVKQHRDRLDGRLDLDPPERSSHPHLPASSVPVEPLETSYPQETSTGSSVSSGRFMSAAACCEGTELL